jgi:hypothetical protein
MVKTSLKPKYFGALRRFKAGIFKVLAAWGRNDLISPAKANVSR